MKKWMISLLSVLALALAFTGCGGSEGGSSADPVTSNPSTSTDSDVNTGDGGNGGDAAVTTDSAILDTIEKSFGAVPANPGQTS